MVPGPQPIGFRDIVEFSKGEVLEVCGRLALVHQCLTRAGDGAAATEVAWVFDLLERRVAF